MSSPALDTPPPFVPTRPLPPAAFARAAELLAEAEAIGGEAAVSAAMAYKALDEEPPHDLFLLVHRRLVALLEMMAAVRASRAAAFEEATTEPHFPTEATLDRFWKPAAEFVLMARGLAATLPPEVQARDVAAEMSAWAGRQAEDFAERAARIYGLLRQAAEAVRVPGGFLWDAPLADGEAAGIAPVYTIAADGDDDTGEGGDVAAMVTEFRAAVAEEVAADGRADNVLILGEEGDHDEAERWFKRADAAGGRRNNLADRLLNTPIETTEDLVAFAGMAMSMVISDDLYHAWIVRKFALAVQALVPGPAVPFQAPPEAAETA